MFYSCDCGICWSHSTNVSWTWCYELGISNLGQTWNTKKILQSQEMGMKISALNKVAKTTPRVQNVLLRTFFGYWAASLFFLWNWLRCTLESHKLIALWWCRMGSNQEFLYSKTINGQKDDNKLCEWSLYGGALVVELTLLVRGGKLYSPFDGQNSVTPKFGIIILFILLYSKWCQRCLYWECDTYLPPPVSSPVSVSNHGNVLIMNQWIFFRKILIWTKSSSYRWKHSGLVTTTASCWKNMYSN